MKETLPGVNSLRRRQTWGTWLTLIGLVIMTSPHDLLAICGLPVAVVGIVVVWPAVKYRKRMVGSVPDPQRATNRKKAGLQTIVGAFGLTLLFLVFSPRVPREHLSVYLVCVLGVMCLSIVVGLMVWKPWKSQAQQSDAAHAGARPHG